ncbi:MAG: phosphatidate cytidylyltransferase [Waddliaceae bacterium]
MILDKLKPLHQRVVVSVFSIAILLFVIAYSFTPYWAPLMPLSASIVIGFAMREYYKIARLKGLQPRAKLGIGLTVAYIFVIFLTTQTSFLDSLPLVTLGITLIAIFSSYFCRGEDPFVGVAITLFAIIYLTIPLSYTIQINYFFHTDGPQDGRWWLFYLFAVTYLTDSSALFIGKTLGARKFAPYISPNKTWEGAIGGFLVAIVVSFVFYCFANIGENPIPIQLSFWHCIFLGSLISILAQFGDLAESLLKRDVGVKDSSKIPGLGGFLDVVDSLVFTAPLLYLYLNIVE